MAKKTQLKHYPEYHIEGKPGERVIVHSKSRMTFGHELPNGQWQNEDDEGGILTASTPDDLVAMNKAATKDYDEHHGF